MIENRTGLRPGLGYEISVEDLARKISIRGQNALMLAEMIHVDDTRKTTGEPYINHCVAVAEILIRWGADEDEIIAGILHDTVEDHPDCLSLSQIEDVFGERVSHLVDGVTKLKSYAEKEGDFETLRKVTRETLVEPGVAIVKLADRLHNMLTMIGFSSERQMAKAKETLSVYVPLAESLGLWQVKNALADISFEYMEPERFKVVKAKIDADPRLNEEFIRNTEKVLSKILSEAEIEAVVVHEVGGYWELAEKQKKSAMRSDSRPKEFADITDVVSFRVMIDDSKKIEECYKAMGKIRSVYGKLLVPSRSDDYLVTSAINGYSALHDTYKLSEGNIEVAFTTVKREKFNNWGVASLSQEDLKKDPDKYKRKLIFTPKKELAIMELGACGIDVAYRLNPLLGLRAVAIKVDGKITELNAIIPNASVVEIMTDQHQLRPNEEWLKYCSRETATQIDSQMIISEHDCEVDKGEKMLVDGLLRERGILSVEDLDEDVVDKLLVDLGCWYGIDDLYYKVAFGLDLSLVAQKFDEMKIGRGMYTTVLVEGKNTIGISGEVAKIIADNGGDKKSNVERVDGDNFMIRALLVVDYEGKKKIEEQLKLKFPNCLVV